jgi:hypothetical protein
MFDIAAMTLIGSDKHSHWGSLQCLHPRPQIQEGILDSFRFGLSDCCVMDMRLDGVDIEWLVENADKTAVRPKLGKRDTHEG